MKKYIKYVIFSLLIFLIIAQFFPIDKTNPSVDQSLDFITIEQPTNAMAKMIKVTCYDCHSHEVKYPWYTSMAPVSWWIKSHIDNGVKKLNFSTWGSYPDNRRKHKLDECVEFVEETRMPILSYIIAHPEARMSEEERAEMVAYFQSLREQ